MDDGNDKRLAIYTAPTMEAWMKGMTDMMKYANTEDVRNIPICLFLDSLQGNRSKADIKKIDKEGLVGRNFSELARELAQWLPEFSSKLADTKVTAFLLNHLKGPENATYSPGGSSIGFLASYIVHIIDSFQTRKAAGPQLFGDNSITLSMKLIKNSFGVSQTFIKLDMAWQYDEEGKQKIWFKWPEATVETLTYWLNIQGAIPKKHPIRDVIGDLSAASAGAYGLRYHSKMLGVSESDKLPPADMAKVLEKFNIDNNYIIDKLFHIPQRKVIGVPKKDPYA